MKNTKKLLMILCSVVVLVATVFTVVSTAVVAGENTSVNEYANMKITASHGFEDGNYKPLFSNIVNGSVPANGSVYTQNNGLRNAVSAIYGNEQSLRYFVIDYDTNKYGSHLYIEPILGNLDNVEKTPVNGFVAEFDMIFLSPVTVLMEQATDENGELLWETLGVDEAGNPQYKQATDEEGNLLWEKNEDGSDKLDDNGNPIPQRIPIMQEIQEPLLTDEFEIEGYEPVYETDENGDFVLDDNGEKIPVYETDENGDFILDSAGNKIQSTVPVYAYEVERYDPVLDENGNPTYEEDDEGNLWPITQPVYKLDENGNKIIKRIPMTDENGEMVMVNKVEKGEFTGLSTTFGITMQNTQTYKDGEVSLLTFKTNSLDENGKIPLDKISGNKLPNAPKFAATPDEWFHIAIQYDAKSRYTYIYVGRDDSEFDSDGDGTIDTYGRMLLGYCKTEDTLESGEVVNVYPLRLRLGCKSTKGVVGFDNFMGYQGTTIHDPTLLNNKLPFEKYLYLADILANGHEYKTEKDADGNVIYEVLKDEDGNTVYEIDETTGEVKLDESGNPIPVYLVDSFGNKVPVYVTDEKGMKEIMTAHNTSANRYQAFNLLTTDDVLRRVHSKDDLGGEPEFEQLEALDAAIALVDVYSADKKNEANNGIGVVGVYDEMVKEAKLENAATYLSYAELALEAERTLSNYEDRAADIMKAEEFYNSVGSMIERDGSGDYGKAVSILNSLQVLVKGDEAASHLVEWMKIFNSSVSYGASVSRLKSHYNNAAYYYQQIEELGDNYHADTFDEKSGSAAAYATAVADYLAAGDIVSNNTKEFNAARFIGIVNVMQKKSTGSWSSDGKEIEELWLRALDILLDNDYDPSSEAFAVAKVIFDSADSYFYGKLQNDHLKIITDKLDSYNDPDMTYIDKAGVCTYVDRYIQLNKKYLDLESIEIKREISRNEAYKSQLDTLVGDYRKLLVENAPRFISVVKMSAHYSTYEDLKPLYDQATEYYYKMNIEGEEIEECIADYEELRNLINAIEKDSKAYIDVVYGNIMDEDGNAIYKPMSQIDNKKELYKSLTEAYLCLENLDITYPGAREAKEIYNVKYKEYYDDAIMVNEELVNSEAVVYAVRGNWTFDTVVTFVKKLINKGVTK